MTTTTKPSIGRDLAAIAKAFGFAIAAALLILFVSAVGASVLFGQ
jgi:hypothetical protein